MQILVGTSKSASARYSVCRKCNAFFFKHTNTHPGPPTRSSSLNGGDVSPPIRDPHRAQSVSRQQQQQPGGPGPGPGASSVVGFTPLTPVSRIQVSGTGPHHIWSWGCFLE